MTTTTATLNLDEVAEFWRIARRLYAVYIELDRTFELDIPTCPELENAADSPEADARERVLQWFEQIDGHVQVWQLRQLLQSTSLQNEENLRYLIARHLDKKQKTEADKDKIDFLLVQYFAHCAPHGLAETALEEVARVLEPAMGKRPDTFPEWASSLDSKLRKLNDSNSLEELQNSGALQEVRELKLAVGDEYFEPGFLVAFTRFNFLARRAFFHAMHLDLHAISEAVNELERFGITTVDCRDAGLTESESLDQVRHVVHQWKTPFRAPYSGGSSFLQLILLRHTLQHTLNEANSHSMSAGGGSAVADIPIDTHKISDLDTNPAASGPKDFFETRPQPARAAAALEPVAFKAEPELMDILDTTTTSPAQDHQDSIGEDDETIQRCVADIHDQLVAVPTKHSPTVSAIILGGCKLLI